MAYRQDPLAYALDRYQARGRPGDLTVDPGLTQEFIDRLQARLDVVLPPAMQEIDRRQQVTQPEENPMHVTVHYTIEPLPVPTHLAVAPPNTGQRYAGKTVDQTEAALCQRLALNLVDTATLNQLCQQFWERVFAQAGKEKGETLLEQKQAQINNARLQLEAAESQLLKALRKLEVIRDQHEALEAAKAEVWELKMELQDLLVDPRKYRKARLARTVQPPKAPRKRGKTNGKGASPRR